MPRTHCTLVLQPLCPNGDLKLRGARPVAQNNNSMEILPRKSIFKKSNKLFQFPCMCVAYIRTLCCKFRWPQAVVTALALVPIGPGSLIRLQLVRVKTGKP